VPQVSLLRSGIPATGGSWKPNSLVTDVTIKRGSGRQFRGAGEVMLRAAKIPIILDATFEELIPPIVELLCVAAQFRNLIFREWLEVA
jgi:hypothetical protein